MNRRRWDRPYCWDSRRSYIHVARDSMCIIIDPGSYWKLVLWLLKVELSADRRKSPIPSVALWCLIIVRFVCSSIVKVAYSSPWHVVAACLSYLEIIGSSEGTLCLSQSLIQSIPLFWVRIKSIYWFFSLSDFVRVLSLFSSVWCVDKLVDRAFQSFWVSSCSYCGMPPLGIVIKIMVGLISNLRVLCLVGWLFLDDNISSQWRFVRLVLHFSVFCYICLSKDYI